MFNSLAVGGLAGLVGSTALDATPLTTVAPVLSAGVGVAVWAMMVTQRRIGRREGIVLIAAYALIFPLVADL